MGAAPRAPPRAPLCAPPPLPGRLGGSGAFTAGRDCGKLCADSTGRVMGGVGAVGAGGAVGVLRGVWIGVVMATGCFGDQVAVCMGLGGDDEGIDGAGPDAEGKVVDGVVKVGAGAEDGGVEGGGYTNDLLVSSSMAYDTGASESAVNAPNSRTKGLRPATSPAG